MTLLSFFERQMSNLWRREKDSLDQDYGGDHLWLGSSEAGEALEKTPGIHLLGL